MDLHRFFIIVFFIKNTSKIECVKIYLYNLPAVGRIGIGSEAIAECQIGAVLLHRVDEELLQRILHSNTSLNKWGGRTAKMNLKFQNLQGTVAASP